MNLQTNQASKQVYEEEREIDALEKRENRTNKETRGRQREQLSSVVYHRFFKG